MSVLKGKNILLGVTGSIAAYKSIILLRLLKKEGADVQVIFSDSANNFVTQLTFSTLSEKKVLTDFFEDDERVDWVNHVELAEWADYMIIAPVTSSTLSKLVSGNSDNLLVATYMSTKCDVFLLQQWILRCIILSLLKKILKIWLTVVIYLSNLLKGF